MDETARQHGSKDDKNRDLERAEDGDD